MKFAIIKTGGKQYLVKEKEKIKVERLKAAVGEDVNFETLLIAEGDKVEIGSPILSEMVTGKIIKESRSKKVIGVKYKPKTREHKKFGHRQYYTEVEIEKI